MKKILIPPVFVFISILLIILTYLLFPEANLITFPFNLSGIIIIFFSLLITGKGRDELTKNKTPYSFKNPTKLVTKGIFSKTRNPMYMGMVILLTGLSVCFQNIFALIIPLLFFLITHFVFIPFEEKTMERFFGNNYLKYKKQVKRWI